MLALDAVLAHFTDPKRVGKSYKTRCPAHDDTSPSLEITDGHTGILFYCRSQHCPVADILAKAGLTWDDVLPPREPRTNGSAQYAAVHDYRDADGVLRYQVLRLDTPAGKPKKFTQRHVGPDGAFVWGMQDVERLPYRLHELYGHTRVFVVEGEKDVDRLWSLGLPATCNTGGAGSWRAGESVYLKAAGVQRVVLLPDNDEPGKAHVLSAAKSLHAAGLSCTVMPPFDGLVKGDVSDWLDAGHNAEHFETWLIDHAPKLLEPERAIVLTPASSIQVRPVKWLWDERVALGTLCLLGGREGVGKSLITYTLAGEITRGTLLGEYFGHPRSVIVAASEDSWEHTIVPRLLGAGADLNRVFRLDIKTTHGNLGLSLPLDIPALKTCVKDVGAALIVLDPLMSRISSELDTHKDAEVRQALEPIVQLAEASGACVLGLIHVNKSASSDPLTLLMGSRAFAAVARSVLFVMVDPDHKTQRLLGQAKNNLGRMDLPTLAFQIAPSLVATTPEGEVWTGRVDWLGEGAQSLHDAMSSSGLSEEDKTARDDAKEWLAEYLGGGSIDSAKIKQDAKRDGHTITTLNRARKDLVIDIIANGKRRLWALPSKLPNDAYVG